MPCPYCHKANIHPGYESACPECSRHCVCGCGLMRSTVIQISKSIDERGEDNVAAIIKMNMKSEVFLKTFGKFINNHYPQHKEIAGKYLAIK